MGNVTSLEEKSEQTIDTGLLEYEDNTFKRREARSYDRAFTEQLICTLAAKKFRYITEPFKPSTEDLLRTPLLKSGTFHFLAKPEEITEQVSGLLRLRAEHQVIQRPWDDLGTVSSCLQIREPRRVLHCVPARGRFLTKPH